MKLSGSGNDLRTLQQTATKRAFFHFGGRMPASASTRAASVTAIALAFCLASLIRVQWPRKFGFSGSASGGSCNVRLKLIEEIRLDLVVLLALEFLDSERRL